MFSKRSIIETFNTREQRVNTQIKTAGDQCLASVKGTVNKLTGYITNSEHR